MRRSKWTGLILCMVLSAMGVCACKGEERVNSNKDIVNKIEAASEVPSTTLTTTTPEAASEVPEATPEETRATSKESKQPKESKSPVESKETSTPKETADSNQTGTSDQTSKQQETSSDKQDIKGIEKMQPILETIALYLCEGNGFDPKNEDCYYEVCAMLGNNVAPEEYPKECKYEEAELTITASAFEEIVRAAFPDQAQTTDIPEDYQDFIRYEKTKNQFVIAATDKADVTGSIHSIKRQNDNYLVEFKLEEEGETEVEGTWLFTLHKSAADSHYPYQVESVKME